MREKSNQLERRLESAESTNARLMEENGELKTEIDSLEAEISEVRVSKQNCNIDISIFIDIQSF